MNIESNIFESREEPPTTESALETNETKSVVAAEDIALAQEEIIQNIIKENIPAEKWKEDAEKTLERYPQLKIYKEYFLVAVQRAIDNNSSVNELWEKVVQDKIVISEDESYKGDNNYQEADEEASKTLFKKAFGKDAVETVKAIKGRSSLTFEVAKKDLDSIRPLDKKGAGGIFTHGTEYNVPIIVVLSAEFAEKQMYTLHETQHLYNELSKLATDQITYDPRPMDMLPKELHKTRERNLKEEDSPSTIVGQRAKGEILSYATLAGLIEMSNARIRKQRESGISNESDEIDESVLQEHWDSVKEDLTEGSYFEEYKKDFNLKEPDIPDYIKRVNAAIDAYVRLTETYKKFFPDRTNRVAINVLAQFPIDKWPAVVRLIRKRRQHN